MKKYEVTLIAGENYQTGMYTLTDVEANDKQDAGEKAKAMIAQCGYFGMMTLEQILNHLKVTYVKEKIDKTKHYFALMRHLEYVPIIGWAFTSSTTPERWVECEIVEDRYKVDDGYKVTLRAIENGFGQEHYYQSDFESLVEQGYIIMKTKEHQHVEDVSWIEPLTDLAYLVHTASVVVDA